MTPVAERPDDLTETGLKLLRIIDNWGGDLSPDAEDDIGAHGAAFDAVIGALIYREYIIVGAWGTYPLTDKGRETLAALSGGGQKG